MLTNPFELHGDRKRGDDPQTETGLAKVGAEKCCYVSNRSGRFTAPAYGKAARLLRLAETVNAPVLFLHRAPALCVAPNDMDMMDAHAELMDALASAGVALIAASEDEPLRQFASPLFDQWTHPDPKAVEKALAHAAEWTPDIIRRKHDALRERTI